MGRKSISWSFSRWSTKLSSIMYRPDGTSVYNVRADSVNSGATVNNIDPDTATGTHKLPKTAV